MELYVEDLHDSRVLFLRNPQNRITIRIQLSTFQTLSNQTVALKGHYNHLCRQISDQAHVFSRLLLVALRNNKFRNYLVELRSLIIIIDKLVQNDASL